MNLNMLYASTSQQVFAQADIVGKVYDLEHPEDLTDEWLIKNITASKTRPW